MDVFDIMDFTSAQLEVQVHGVSTPSNDLPTDLQADPMFSHISSHDCPVDRCVFLITTFCSYMNDFLDRQKSNNKALRLGFPPSPA